MTNVKYCAGYTGSIASDSAMHSLKYLREDTADLKKRYIVLGFHLNEFDSNKYYREFGYDNLTDFCYDNLGLDKGAVSRCLNVWERFARCNEGSSVRTMFIAEKYADYNYTQLTEMLPLSDKELEKITPDMTCKQIREYKKELKNTKNSNDFEDNVPFDTLLVNGTLICELVRTIENFYRQHGVAFAPPIMTAKQIIFKFDSDSYKIMLMCPKKEYEK